MSDIFSEKKRRKIMQSVRSKDTKLESKFRKKLWHRGFRYSLNSGKYYGKPDLVLRKYNTVIFIDSCFWHGCPEHYKTPSTRQRYWDKKIERNKKRDQEVTKYYKNKSNWQIIRIWGHDIKPEKCLKKTINSVVNKIKQQKK